MMMKSMVVTAPVLVCAGLCVAQIGDRATDRITPRSTDRLDLAGFDIAASGDWLFVSQPQESVSGFNTGAVAPFRFDDSIGEWVEVAQVFSPFATSDQFFGIAIAADEDTLVVGIPQDSRVELGGGAVEVFTRLGDQWVFDHELFAFPPQERGDLFGSSVAVNGDLLVVGTPSADPRGRSSGRATIFERRGRFFEPVLQLEQGDEDDLYGWSVALGDGFVAVGTFNIDGDTFSFRGRGVVDVYEEVGRTWELVATLEQDVPGFNERFAWSIDAADGVIAVGAYNEGPVPGLFVNPGAVYMYEKVAGEWARTERIEAADAQIDQQFGFDVDLSPDGNFLLVGAQNDPEAGEDAGAIYVYERDGSSWSFVRKIIPQVTGLDAERGQFGTSVAVTTTSTGETWVFGGAPESYVEGFRAGDVYGAPLVATCDVDCDGSGTLDIFDFLCFQSVFDAGDPKADCDGSGDLDFFDFLCFQRAFDDGCP